MTTEGWEFIGLMLVIAGLIGLVITALFGPPGDIDIDGDDL